MSDTESPLVLNESEWTLIQTALRTAREQWSYDHKTARNTGQQRVADQFLKQYLDAGDLLTKIENRP